MSSEPQPQSLPFPGKKQYLRILLLILAAALVILGVLLGENKETRRQAHYLCFECIGIG